MPDIPESQVDVSDDSPDDSPPPPKADVPTTRTNPADIKPGEDANVYTREMKLLAATVWITNGTVRGTALQCGYPHQTVRRWVASKWWKAAVEEARHKFEDEITGNLSRVVQKAQEKLLTRIEEGDEVIVQGELRMKQVGARDLALIQAIAFDKRQIIGGRPTSISRRSRSAAEIADDLRKKSSRLRDGKPLEPEPPEGLPEVSNVVPFDKARKA